MDRLDRIENSLRRLAFEFFTHCPNVVDDILEPTKCGYKYDIREDVFFRGHKAVIISRDCESGKPVYILEYTTKYVNRVSDVAEDCICVYPQPVIDEIIDKAMLDKNTISRFSGDGSPEDVYHTITLTTKALFKILSQYKLERK